MYDNVINVRVYKLSDIHAEYGACLYTREYTQPNNHVEGYV